MFSLDLGARSRTDYIGMLTRQPTTPVHLVATRITKREGDRPTIVVRIPFTFPSLASAPLLLSLSLLTRTSVAPPLTGPFSG